MRRWLFRIFLVLLILIAVIAIAVQVVLWTNLPRNLVVAQVQKQLGLRVETRGFVTGWGGKTRLDDVKLSLPLADESFFDVSSMRVEHTSLLWLILTRHVDVTLVELNDAKLVVRQDPKSGQWNLQEAIKLVGRTAAGGEPEPGTKKSPPKLPAFNLKNASVRIIDKSGKTAQIEPLNITGRPEGALVYRYQGGVKDRIDITGDVAPGQQWQHEVKLTVDRIEPWLKDWLANAPTPIHLKGSWRGIVDKGKLFARLTIDESQAGEYSAGGSASLETSGSSSMLRPASLILKTPNTFASQVELAGGSIAIEGRTITATQISVSSAGGRAILDGTGDLAARSGNLSAQWQQTLSALKHEGTFKGSLTTLWPARPQIEGTFTTRGDMRSNTWDGSMTIAGIGRTWQDIDWTITVPKASLDRKPATQATTQPGTDLPPLVQIEQLTARVTTHGNQITMTEISLPAAERLMGRVTVDLAKPRWYVQSSGRTKARPRGEETMFDFDVEAFGDWNAYTLDHLRVIADDVQLDAKGDYQLKRPRPMDVEVAITNLPAAEALAKDPTIKGTLIATGKVQGNAYPTDLAFTATVFTRHLSIEDRPIGMADIVINGTAKESIEFKSDQFDVFGGHWNLIGQWPGKKQSLRVTANVTDLSIEQVAAALKLPPSAGVLKGSWSFDLPRLKRDRIDMEGEASAVGLSYRGIPDVPLEADQATAKMSLENGLLRVTPIDLARRSGTAQASVELTLEKAKHPIVSFTSKSYPVEMPASSLMLAVSADAPRMQVDLEKKSAGGEFKAKALVATTQTALGEASVEGAMRGRLIDAEKIIIDAFGGHGDGAVRFNIDEPMKMMARLDVSKLTGERLAAMFPERLEGLSGNYSAAFSIEPSVAARAVEPLRVRLIVRPENARYRAVEIGEMKFSAFMGNERFVLDKLPSEGDEPWNIINIAGGTIDLWARMSQQVDRRTQSHVTIHFDHLDLDQLVHAADPEAEPMPGKLTGTVTLFGSFRNLDQVIGDGSVELTESDLKNTDVLEVLYNALNVGSDPRTPMGRGTVDLRLESSTLRVDHLRYFNRGVEVRAQPIISKIWEMPDSPLSGFAAGTARPLQDIKLPLLADVDQIMNVIQPTTVELSGTVRQPKVRLIPFGEAGESMKRFFLGDVNTEVRKKPE